MKSFVERREECSTDTQYKVMLSGYHWCAEQISDIAKCTILDAACGTGYGTYCLAGKAKKAVGIDICSKAISLCKRRYQRDNLTFIQMDCSDLAFDDDSFDVVISQDTIEHLRDDRRFLSEIRRVLIPNGLFIVFTPHSKEHNNKPGNIYHLREYSKESFHNLLADYFSSIRFYGRRPSKELARLEQDLDRVRGYDRFGIRRILPRSFRHFIADLVAKAKGEKRLEDISFKDIEYFCGTVDTPTLIAVCKNI